MLLFNCVAVQNSTLTRKRESENGSRTRQCSSLPHLILVGFLLQMHSLVTLWDIASLLLLMILFIWHKSTSIRSLWVNTTALWGNIPATQRRRAKLQMASTKTPKCWNKKKRITRNAKLSSLLFWICIQRQVIFAVETLVWLQSTDCKLQFCYIARMLYQ